MEWTTVEGITSEWLSCKRADCDTILHTVSPEYVSTATTLLGNDGMTRLLMTKDVSPWMSEWYVRGEEGGVRLVHDLVSTDDCVNRRPVQLYSTLVEDGGSSQVGGWGQDHWEGGEWHTGKGRSMMR